MDLDLAHKHLSQDPKMKSLLHKHRVTVPKISSALYLDLLESIIGQQLSVKAASTIINRFKNSFSDPKIITPGEILAKDEISLKSVGLSRQKVSYLYSLSEAILNSSLNLESLPNLSDEEVITSLIQVKGIGRWTAEMMLIFSLGRNDVFSLGDLGLRTAVSRIYEVDREDKKIIEKISLTWAPYRSLASLYLWRSLDNET